MARNDYHFCFRANRVFAWHCTAHAIILLLLLILTSSSRRTSAFSVPPPPPSSSFKQQQLSSKDAPSFERTRRSATSTSRRTQLRRIAQSVAKLGEQQTDTSGGCEQQQDRQLVQALHQLSVARTTRQVLDVLPLINVTHITTHQQPHSVMERVVKALSITGLLTQALHILDVMLERDKYTPTEMCQIAIADALRRSGRLDRLELLLKRFDENSNVNNGQQQKKINPVSIVAWNTYLAGLCDVASEKDIMAMSSQQRQPPQASAAQGALDKAVEMLLRHKNRSDSISYATVLQASAGNSTLVDSIWKLLRAQNVPPNMVAYNARMASLLKSKKGNLENSDSDKAVLELWDNEILKDPTVQPVDRYSIDLVLLPLVRAGRVGDVEALLDGFVNRSSDVSNAFAAFLITLVKGGELSTARALFELYILPTLLPVVFGEAGGMIRMVKPMTRHFNALFEGYRRQAEQVIDPEKRNSIMEEGWELYRMLVSSNGVQPDSFSVTSMMGMCRNSTELSQLLLQAFSDLGIKSDSVVFRAALTAYGSLGDPSSALWLFARAAPRSTRNWNVMLGALARATASSEYQSICIEDAVIPLSSTAASTFTPCMEELPWSLEPLQDFLVPAPMVDTVKFTLDVMSNERIVGGNHRAPLADSQTFCVAASILQHQQTTNSTSSLATELYRNATIGAGMQADGRFVNALLRCFGEDLDGALRLWKYEIRPACVAYENRSRSRQSPSRKRGKNLLAAYNGLLYVAGRAVRPDIAVRLSYAMNKEGLEPSEVSLNSYRAGKQIGSQERLLNRRSDSLGSKLKERFRLTEQFESLLYVECTKYNRNDRRRTGEKRLRIIM